MKHLKKLKWYIIWALLSIGWLVGYMYNIQVVVNGSDYTQILKIVAGVISIFCVGTIMHYMDCLMGMKRFDGKRMEW